MDFFFGEVRNGLYLRNFDFLKMTSRFSSFKHLEQRKPLWPFIMSSRSFIVGNFKKVQTISMILTRDMGWVVGWGGGAEKVKTALTGWKVVA